MSRNQQVNTFDLPVIIGIAVIVFTIGLVIFLSRKAGENAPDSGSGSQNQIEGTSSPVLKSGNQGADLESGSQGADNKPESVKKAQIPEPLKLKVEILKEGAGEGAKIRERVRVNYVGTLENGTKFDSSYDRNAPFEFTLGAGEVIRGWDEGVLGMKIGEKRRIVVPSELGYGASGVPGAIPPGATLIFEIERLEIN